MRRFIGRNSQSGQPPGDGGASWDDLQKAWDNLSEQEQELVEYFQQRAAEEQALAEDLEQRGDSERADEVRRRAEHFVLRAEDMLTRVLDALAQEREVERFELNITAESETKQSQFVRDNLSDLQSALAQLNDAIQSANGVSDETRRSSKELYGRLESGLATCETDQTAAVPIWDLRHFLHEVQQSKAADVKAAWRRNARLLDPIL